MGRLFNLKEWLTVADAARHLSIVFGEDMTEADVLRLALDGRLRLSVYFVNHAEARCGKVIPWEETDWWLAPVDGFLITKSAGQATTGEYRRWPQKLEALFNEIPDVERENYCPMMRDLNIGSERFLRLSDDVTILTGVWDLPMIGNEQLDIEHKYQSLTGGPAVTLQGLDGAFVEGRDGQVCQLQERFEQRARPAKKSYYPAGGLPEDAVIVVRTEALREFEQLVNGVTNGPEKPIATIERNSLLTIIAALCDYSAIKPQERGAASQIAKLTEEIGASVSDDTVRRVLERIPGALESRMK
jgi:hypothetical protein